MYTRVISRRIDTLCLRVLFTCIYKLYRLGDRRERCGTPAYISRGVDISPSTEFLNILFERNELISLIMIAKIAVWIIYITSQGAM
jgi:hypothetical protein